MPLPSPRDLPDPGNEPGSLVSQVNSLPSEPPRELLPLWFSFPSVKLGELPHLHPKTMGSSAQDIINIPDYWELLALTFIPVLGPEMQW